MQSIHGGNIWEASRTAGRGRGELIDFSSSINPEGLARGAQEAAHVLLNTPGLAAAYPDPDSRELTRAISQYLGAGVREKNILVGNGSTEFIYMIPKVLGLRKALIVEPAFSEYASALTADGVEAAPFFCKEDDDFFPDTAALKKTIKELHPDILYMANPTNPMGRLMEKEMVLEMADYCKGLGMWLVVDEAFIDFNEEFSIKKEASDAGHIIVLRSMTKFFAMAALRLGYIIAGKGLVERFISRIPTWSVNTVASVAGAASLSDAEYIQRARIWLKKENPLMREALSKIESLKTYPSAANFFSMRLTKDGITAPRLRQLLLQRGFLIRDLSNIRGLGETFFRIAVRGHRDNNLVISELRAILERKST